MRQGRAVVVKNHYTVVSNGRQKVLVYTDSPLWLDDEYALDGKFEKIQQTKGFFRFDTESWAHSMGAYYSMDGEDCTLIQEHFSLRQEIQKKVAAVEDANRQEQLYHLLLNIKTDQENENEDFLYDHGFTYAGMLMCINTLLKYFLSPKKRKRVMLAMNLGLLILYHAPMLLMQSFLFRLFDHTKLDTAQKTAGCLSCILFLYPGCLCSLSFLIPACYRLSFLFHHNSRKTVFFIVLCLQSIFLHHVNAAEMLLYPVNLVIIGLLWFLGMLSLWVPGIPIVDLCTMVNQCNSWLKVFTVYGSLVGLGFVFYFLLCLSFRKSQHKIEIYSGLLFLFLCTGMFHPFAEVTTINVGQGDSILIRQPFNTQNVLIDTGKPSQWNALNDYLHSKGIRQIDTLVITHADSDHSGNMDAVTAQYHPKQVITTHQEEITSGKLVFYDLNTIQNEDENESCIVLAARFNHLNYLFMGDADRTAEEKIVQKYDALQCDVLKLSHHGSNTGSCTPFLDTVRPQIGLISSGAYAIYHHPSPDTIQQLLKRHITYFDTKEEGDVSILAFMNMNLLITSDGKLGIIG
jgi:competence protein ComEC